MKIAANGLAAGVMLCLASTASTVSAAGFELVGVDMSGSHTVTLMVGSLSDLKSLLGDVGFDEGNDTTSFENSLSEAGLTFTYSGSWADSPLIPAHTGASGGISSLSETSASGQRFSLDFAYTSPFKLNGGTELVTFSIKSPLGASGRIELTSVKLNPFTIDTGNLIPRRAPLASYTISSVPEPSNYLVVIFGMAALGLARRIRYC